MAVVKYYWELSNFHGRGEPLKETIIHYFFDQSGAPTGMSGGNYGGTMREAKSVWVKREADRYSSQLITLVKEGRVIPKAILKVKHFTGKYPTMSMRIILNDVMLISYQPSSSEASDTIHEMIGLSFSNMKIENTSNM